ncbi:tail assembly chaperone [Mycobacterium phage JF1]|nr:tail assembly chaperone [Mycobacterium phage JF1]
MELNSTPAADDGQERVDTEQPVVAEAQPDQSASVAAEWADEYEEGAELFCAVFDADDFDTEYGKAYPSGTTLAVKRCLRKPPPGWIRQHAHLSDLERTFALVEKHCSDKALDILDSLTEKAWNDFVEAWGQGRWPHRGKIHQICAAVRQVEDAIRRDLIVAGREFDDGTLSWDDLYAFIFAAPPNTAVFHAFEKGWITTDYLLAHVIDRLDINNWQRTEDAHKKPPRNVPKPFPRPADDSPQGKQRQQQQALDDRFVHVGNGVMATKTTVAEFLEMRAERERRWREKHGKKGG